MRSPPRVPDCPGAVRASPKVAFDYYQEALIIVVGLGDQQAVANALCNLTFGRFFVEDPEVSEASARLEASLQI
ncbi:MAG: hypothetical protein ACRDVM_04115 [Acidimicrobiia bacterium]